MPMGVMIRQFKVICGCGKVQDLMHAAAWSTARADAKALGWKNTKGSGWLCPECCCSSEVERRFEKPEAGGSTPPGNTEED